MRTCAVFAAAMIVFVGLQTYVPTAQVFRDMPHAVLEAGPGEPLPLLGFMSNLGVLLWCTSAAVAGFGAALVHNLPGARGAGFLAWLSVFSAVLMADDFFLLHEDVFPRLFGLEEKALLGLYGLVFTSGLVAFRRVLRQGAWPLLALAVAFHACAVAADLAKAQIPDAALQRWLEDGLKFVGIVFWAAFALRAAWLLCMDAVDDAQFARDV